MCEMYVAYIAHDFCSWNNLDVERLCSSLIRCIMSDLFCHLRGNFSATICILGTLDKEDKTKLQSERLMNESGTKQGCKQSLDNCVARSLTIRAPGLELSSRSQGDKTCMFSTMDTFALPPKRAEVQMPSSLRSLLCSTRQSAVWSSECSHVGMRRTSRIEQVARRECNMHVPDSWEIGESTRDLGPLRWVLCL